MLTKILMVFVNELFKKKKFMRQKNFDNFLKIF